VYDVHVCVCVCLFVCVCVCLSVCVIAMWWCETSVRPTPSTLSPFALVLSNEVAASSL